MRGISDGEEQADQRSSLTWVEKLEYQNQTQMSLGFGRLKKWMKDTDKDYGPVELNATPTFNSRSQRHIQINSSPLLPCFNVDK